MFTPGKDFVYVTEFPSCWMNRKSPDSTSGIKDYTTGLQGLYDAAIKLFAYLAGGGEEHFRGEYLRELEVQDGDRVLEVSIGTGANLHYLPVKASLFWVGPLLGNAEKMPEESEAVAARSRVDSGQC